MAYVLEIGTFESVKMPYTYARRAQATLHRTVWRQIAMCAEFESLERYAATIPGSCELRITGVGEHCLFEPRSVLAEGREA